MMENKMDALKLESDQSKVKDVASSDIKKIELDVQVVAPDPDVKVNMQQNIGAYSVSTGDSNSIDYDAIVSNWGCKYIDEALLKRIERLTGKKPHRYLRRNIYYSHRELNSILDDYEKGVPFYLYTGRGPSSDALHLGHLVPFVFCKWLQDAFNVPLVIQITDDEKFWAKDLSLEQCSNLARENIKDILSLGFDPSKTFIFINTDYIQYLYPVAAKIAKCINVGTIQNVFGFSNSTNAGLFWYPALQAAPCFPEVFPTIFRAGKAKKIRCLIPSAIDQDPFFRLTKDVAQKMKRKRPANLYSKFFPGLKGQGTKMSSSDPNWKESTIFVTDTPKQIRKKINKHAFSGGGITLEEHKENGANLSVDVPWAWLQYLMEDDEKLRDIGNKYESGEMLTGEIKEILAKEVIAITTKLQEERQKITDAAVNDVMNPILETRSKPWAFEL